ncbi:MAG: hypothetical protein P8X57_12670 [Cyclobacteriaceae bacterium]
MNKSTIRYLIGAAMIAFGFYEVSTANFWESSLYFSAGLAFISIGMLMSEQFVQYKKILNIASWVLIILAVFLFFYLLRTDQYVS